MIVPPTIGTSWVMVGKYISQQHSLYLTDGSKLNIVNKPKLSKKLLIEGKSQKEGGKVDYSSLFLIMGGFHSIIKKVGIVREPTERKNTWAMAIIQTITQ